MYWFIQLENTRVKLAIDNKVSTQVEPDIQTMSSDLCFSLNLPLGSVFLCTGFILTQTLPT